MELVKSLLLRLWMYEIYIFIFVCFQDQTASPVMIVVMICLTFWSFSLAFFFCEFGELISSNYGDLPIGLYDNKWYFYPLNEQRMIPTILIGTQDVVTLCGFGNVRCTRETFKTVWFLVCQSNPTYFYRIFLYRLVTQASHTLWFYANLEYECLVATWITFNT